MMTSDQEPKLAPPGAGLPTVELYIGRLAFAVKRWSATRESCNEHFRRERAAIRKLVDSCDEETGARRVLIRHPPGLEDSSRFWSVFMTLDHLRIVHLEFVRVIEALTIGTMPGGTASTAAVKPSPEASASVNGSYEESCDALLAAVARARDLRTTLRFAHPWFGPLNAADWHALAGGHMRIHRVQIERILTGIHSSRS